MSIKDAFSRGNDNDSDLQLTTSLYSFEAQSYRYVCYKEHLTCNGPASCYATRQKDCNNGFMFVNMVVKIYVKENIIKMYLEQEHDQAIL